MSNLRTWDAEKRCAECCNGDRCDDPTHYDRSRCPHCRSTGWAIWTTEGKTDYAKYRGWGSYREDLMQPKDQP